MTATERITMTIRDLDRFKVIKEVADSGLKPWRAAERLGLTPPQIPRLVGRLRERGPQSLVSQRLAKISDVQEVLLDKIIAQHAEVVSAQQVIDAMSAWEVLLCEADAGTGPPR